jgi:hypothetical protein
MKASTRALVRSRAARRCEYCRLHEDDLPLFTFHIEHILPKKHGGTDDPKLLAWSCHFCNLAKSSNLRARERITWSTFHRENKPEAPAKAGVFLRWRFRLV